MTLLMHDLHGVSPPCGGCGLLPLGGAFLVLPSSPLGGAAFTLPSLSWCRSLPLPSHLQGGAAVLLSFGVGQLLQKIAAYQITASDLNTFTNTFLINMRMKFITTTT